MQTPSLPPPPPLPSFSNLSSASPVPSSSSSPFPPSSSSSASHINDALQRDFPQVASLSRDDMQLLLEDPAYFDAYFYTQLPRARELDEEVEQKMRDNIALAQQSEQMRPALEALREDTARLFNEAQKLKQRWGYLEEAQAVAYKRFSEPAQLSRMRAATTLQERLSDSLVASFLSGQGEQDEESFVKGYREVRKVFYRREIGLKKWEGGGVVWM